MSTTPRTLGGTNTTYGVQQGTRTAGLVGLVARGALYIALAVLALELVFGDRSESADPRGASMNSPTRGSASSCSSSSRSDSHCSRPASLPRDQESGQQDEPPCQRRVLGRRQRVLAVLAASFLFTSKSSGDTDQTDKTLTAKVMDMSGGRLLVGAVGLGRSSDTGCISSGARSLTTVRRAGRARSSPKRDADGSRPVQIRQLVRWRDSASSACSCSPP